MNSIKLICILCFTILFGQAAHAKNIWRDCGIGALLFPKTGWAAVTSNIIWDLGTTASTSTSSSENQCAGKGASVARYIHHNYAAIELETAKGHGEYLVTMLSILECKPASRAHIIEGFRKNFGVILADPAYEQKSDSSKAEIYFNKFLQDIETNHSLSCQLT